MSLKNEHILAENDYAPVIGQKKESITSGNSKVHSKNNLIQVASDTKTGQGPDTVDIYGDNMTLKDMKGIKAQ